MKIIVIYGPTASGKSSLAVAQAAQRNGVVINADSMQVYDALHVLTAQPPAEEQEQIPHALYAALHPAEKCSAPRWRDMAVNAIEQAHSKGHTPIVVGGTGFYIKTLMQGLSPIPDVPAATRARAMALQAELGNPAFHTMLAEKDPEMAARLNPNDTQRLVRAWEVLEATGRSLAYWQALPPEGPPAHWEFETSFVNPDRETLYQRCNARFDLMLETGILEEVAALDARISAGEVPENAPVTHALGFHALRDHLHGRRSLEDAIAQAKQETRRYAKRQVSWLRNQI